MKQERRPFAPAYLPSHGLNERRATLHKYEYSEVVTLPAPGGKPGETVTGLGHFYRCADTNELRRWGFDASYRIPEAN